MAQTRGAFKNLSLATIFMLSSGLPAQAQQPVACGENTACPRAFRCSEGICVPRCQPPSELPAFDDGCFPDVEKIWFSQGGPGSDPGCATCSATFELAPLRRLLEVAALSQPATLRLLDKGGLLLAELGTFTPEKEKSWAALPETVDAPLAGRLRRDGSCGYQLEIRDPKGEASVRRSVCLVRR